MQRSLSRLQAVVLGIVVLAGTGLATLGLGAVASRQWLWSDTFTLSVGFAQVRGVEVGTRVRVQGIDAGEVAAVLPPEAPGGDVVLQLRLDGKLRHLVRADARAQILSEGMIGGRVVEIDPGSASAEPVADGARITSQPAPELGDVLARVDGVLQAVKSGEGTLGKLLTDDELHGELVGLARQGRGTLASIKQDADALKQMPVVRNYVKDARQLLVRPDYERNRQWFREADLFEPGRAVLTSQGRQALDNLVPWLEGLKHKGSEVVVVAYAAPTMEPDFALTLTQKQSEAVWDYLTGQHGVQKMSWFTRRKVTPLGCGVQPPPVPEKDDLPVPRVDVLVFVPQG